jgi:ketol-acid reductoisomerase
MNVIVGVRKDGASWKQAQEDGWVPGKNLFEVEEAIKKGTIVMNLLSVHHHTTKITLGCRAERNMA